MPAPITELATAQARLIAMVEATKDPVLTSSGANNEIDGLLTEFKRASLWVTATAYFVNDVVQPTANNRTGRRYICVAKGTSGATEPTWPDGELDRITDGTTLVWEEAGPEYDLWDLIAAANKGWMLKAAKASERYQFQEFGDGLNRQQVYEHCLQMARQYAPVMVA